jgi:hypothetical protein
MKINISQKILKIISLTIAIFALCGTVLYSQQSKKKKDPNKPKNNVFHTSKSMMPPTKDAEENTTKDSSKTEKPIQKPEQTETIKPDKIFPSTKAPMTP